MAKLLLHAAPVALGVLGLMLYWFGVANRAVLFLYDHDMGPRVPDTSAFSLVTRSRYWMAGLVAAGLVLVCYTLAAFCLGRGRRGYRPPPWPRVWLLAALPLAVAIPLVTMTLNTPTLPLPDALLVTTATLSGLALALPPADLAARAPGRLVWLAVDGAGAAALALSLTFGEQAYALLRRGSAYGVLLLGIGGAVGVALLVGGSLLPRSQRAATAGVGAILAAGVGWAYLVLPATHHLFFTDGWFYITTMDNFFPSAWLVWLAGWTLTAAVVGGIVKGRRRAGGELP